MDTFVPLTLTVVVLVYCGTFAMPPKKSIQPSSILLMMLACVSCIALLSIKGVGAESLLFLGVWIAIFSASVYNETKAHSYPRDASALSDYQEEIVRKLEGDLFERPGQPCAVMYVNASHLGEVAKFKAALISVVRDCAKEAPLKFVGDIGQGEFVLVLFSDPVNLRSRISALAQLIHAANIDEDQMESRVPWIRIGACLESSPCRNASKLVRRATLASGMNIGNELWREFDSAFHQKNLRREEIISELRGALKRAELTVVYQPIVQSGSGNLAKFEALVRWRNRRFGEIGPGEFIPLAEQAGLMIDIGEFVLRAACMQLSDWLKRATTGVQMSVNVSQCQLEIPGYATRVNAMLKRLSIPVELLELEVTERILVESSELVSKSLTELKESGIRIAIDDFGTGTSALSALSQFSFDTLKIDRSFLTAVETEERSMHLYESICALGQRLGMCIVAEGVETEAQANWLCSRGVHYQQGWLHGRAVGAAGASNRAFRCESEFVRVPLVDSAVV